MMFIACRRRSLRLGIGGLRARTATDSACPSNPQTKPQTTSSPSEFEHLQSIVPGVDGHDAVVLVDGDAPRVGQLAWLALGRAPRLEALAGLLVDQLHPVVAELADDQAALVVD